MTVAAPAAVVSQPAARPSVTLIIPALNEAENLPWVLERIPASVDEVILVDGYSTDDTVAVARRCRPDIRVVQQRGRGKGMAVRTGFDAATGEYIVMMDADGSMHPAEIDDFVTALSEGYQFVKGSRYLPEAGSTDITRLRNWGNRCLVTAVNTMFAVPFSDLCYGFVAFRRDVLPVLQLTAHGFEIETELILHAIKARLRIAEVPSMELERRNGVSNLNTFRDGGRVFRTLARERLRRRPPLVVDSLHRRPATETQVTLAVVHAQSEVTTSVTVEVQATVSVDDPLGQ
ncbi:glycosyltransferase family 2 protein [Georgenia sp. EYE_87]|uniref:glycosyltransferase family 2 protein n=1 Tax=Georgenia sp. EYE_87 TaxID=2853448 RepID=UPI002005C548|nr:glycosyltransferase family 2 protein [Georgenia sp. EYE_87]MCK6209397.1 glycosyltransferase family 2 protein [Georgenia sp. EYE_87]